MGYGFKPLCSGLLQSFVSVQQYPKIYFGYLLAANQQNNILKLKTLLVEVGGIEWPSGSSCGAAYKMYYRK